MFNKLVFLLYILSIILLFYPKRDIKHFVIQRFNKKNKSLFFYSSDQMLEFRK